MSSQLAELLPAHAPRANVPDATAHSQTIQSALTSGNLSQAEALARQRVAAAPGDPEAWNTLGVALRANGRAAAAVLAYRRAIDINPDLPGVWSNCGNAFKDLQRFDEAIDCHRRAMEGAPQSGKFAANYGVALRDYGRYEEALKAYDMALALEPNNVDTRFDRAQVLLMLGNYQQGWVEFEWRWRLKNVNKPSLRQPLWDGSNQRGKTLMLWPEQGFGDTILSVRFAQQARARVGRLVLACQPELARLFRGLEAVDQVVGYGEPLPPADVQCPLMSLPRFFVAEPQAAPAPARLQVPEAARRKLAVAMAGAGDRLRVGIVWSGSLTFKSNHLRATALDRFLALGAVPGLQLFSLQKGPRAADLASSGADSVVIDLAPHLDDFADTAAAIAGLDLVIMTDSSVAHLAGSLCKPIWNLLPRNAYWLYGNGVSDTPWYPSMRLFRQETPGDWDGVFARVADALDALVRARRGKSVTTS